MKGDMLVVSALLEAITEIRRTAPKGNRQVEPENTPERIKAIAESAYENGRRYGKRCGQAVETERCATLLEEMERQQLEGGYDCEKIAAAYRAGAAEIRRTAPKPEKSP